MSDMPKRICAGEATKGVMYALPIEMIDEHDVEYIRADIHAAEVERLRAALQEIERFGHGMGHGRGYTCATMAAKALGDDK